MMRTAKYKFTIIGHRPTIPQVTTDDIEVEVEYDSKDIRLKPLACDPKRKAAGEAAEIIADRREEQDDEHPWYFLCATDPVKFVLGYD